MTKMFLGRVSMAMAFDLLSIKGAQDKKMSFLDVESSHNS